MPDLEKNLWNFFRPFIRPARIIVLLITLYLVSNIDHLELLQVLQNTSLANAEYVAGFLLNKISFLKLIISIFIVFIANPLLTGALAKWTSDLLKPRAEPLMLNLYGVWIASKLDLLSNEDRMQIFNSYSKAHSLFLMLREAIELILPLSCLLWMISSHQLAGTISVLVIALLLFWLCVQRLLILYLRDIAPFELTRRALNSR